MALSKANRPRYLFSGMLRLRGLRRRHVGDLSDAHRLLGRARNKGTCENRRTIARTELERRVLGALSSRLMEPEVFAVFCEEFTAETNRMRRMAAAQVTDRANELLRVTAAIDRLVQAIIDETPARAVKERLEALEARRDELEARRASRRKSAAGIASGHGGELPPEGHRPRRRAQRPGDPRRGRGDPARADRHHRDCGRPRRPTTFCCGATSPEFLGDRRAFRDGLARARSRRRMRPCRTSGHFRPCETYSPQESRHLVPRTTNIKHSFSEVMSELLLSSGAQEIGKALVTLPGVATYGSVTMSILY